MVRTRNKISKDCIVIIIVVLSLVINFSMNRINVIDSAVSVFRSTSQNYTVHDPIVITNDVELAAVATSGMGTANHPYIISSWNITQAIFEAIFITGTTKYFRIEHCWIVNSTNSGIRVENVAPGTITITNNFCFNNGISGIYVESSGISTLTNNVCTGNGFYDTSWAGLPSSGITLFNSSSSIIVNNSCTYNLETDIYIKESSNLAVANNTCINGGIYLKGSHSSTVATNSYTNCDIHLEESGSSIVANNTYTNGGIYLEESTASIVINNIFNYNEWGVGIQLLKSGSSTVANNTCTNGGIYLKGSRSSTITNNTCTNNSRDGILLEASGSSNVTNNICTGNTRDGIHFEASGSSIIAYNTCNNNGEGGFFFYYSDNNFIILNTLIENGNYGIEFSKGSNNNIIHHNSFIENGQDNSQARDNGTYNQWYDETVLEGNYWSDYSGIGKYLIVGSANASDPHPIDNPFLTKKGIDYSSLLIRISLFLTILGVLVVSLFLNRRKKGF